MSAELARVLDAIERELQSDHGNSFAARVQAIEQLELHFSARLAVRDESARTLAARAEKLSAELEARNQRVARRLRARIAGGRFTKAGLRRALLAGSVSAQSDELDWRDALLAELVDVAELGTERAAPEPDLVFYQPTPVRVILTMLERADLRSGDQLCDLGSGLGQVLVTSALVSDVPVLGIEREPAYCEYVMQAIERLALTNVQVVCGDARSASFGASNVFFMYTPFRGQVLQQVLARLEQHATQRALRLCTFGPCTLDVSQQPWLELQSEQRSTRQEVAVFVSTRR